METENTAMVNEGLPVAKKPPLLELTKRDTVFAVCALALTVFFSLFGLFDGVSLGYSLSSTAMLVMFFAYFAKDAKFSASAVVCGLLALASGAIRLCTTNGSVRFFGTVVGLLLSLVCFDGLVNGAAKGNRRTAGIFYSAVSTLGNVGLSVRSLFVGGTGKKRFGKALVGLLCAVPVLVVIIPLLISSDDAFRGMMSKIFSNTFSSFAKTIFGVLVCPFVISYGLSLKFGRVTERKKGRFAGVENVYLISFLSAISVCYLLYLFSQLAYFFSAFRGFLPDGEITYAQYARKGFFEMCVIAAINLLIVFVALLLAKKNGGKVCHAIKAIATFISVFSLIIIATAISKMVLYIGTYGMTVLRITTSAFMLFLSIVFISVILRIYLEKINVVKTALITAGCIVLTLGIANVNAVCARYNYESYKSGKLDRIDVQAMYNLGCEGVPYVVRLASDDDATVADKAERYLVQAYSYKYFDDVEDAEDFTVEALKSRRKDRGFAYFNLPKAAAYRSLYAYAEENPWFAEIYLDNFVEEDQLFF